MSTDAKYQEEDLYENWTKLEYTEQFKVLSYLPIQDRLRFSFTSRTSCYLSSFLFYEYHGFELYGFSATHWRIYAVKNKYEKNEERKVGLFLDIIQDNETGYVRCSDIDGTEYWEEDMTAEMDAYRLATDYFKCMLRVNMNKIKKLVICGHNLADFDFGIKSMKKLESLEIDGDVDIHHFLPNIGHYLKNLTVRTRPEGQPLSKYRDIYHVSHSLHLTYTTLTYKQFRRVRARCLVFSIGDLTPEDLFKFINGFREVDFYEDTGDYQWNIRYSGFDVKELFQLLKISEKDAKEEIIEIKQVSYPRKHGNLSVTKSTIKFVWDFTKKPTELGKEDKKVAE